MSDYTNFYDKALTITQGNYNKALKSHEKSLNINLVTVGENHPDAAGTTTTWLVSTSHKATSEELWSTMRRA